MHVLFRIVSGVREDSWIEPAVDAIKTHNNDAMFIRFNEFFIKKYSPLCVKEFATTVGEERWFRALSAGSRVRKVFEIVR